MRRRPAQGVKNCLVVYRIVDAPDFSNFHDAKFTPGEVSWSTRDESSEEGAR